MRFLNMDRLLRQLPWMSMSAANTIPCGYDCVVRLKRESLRLRKSRCGCTSDARTLRAAPSRRKLIGELDYHMEPRFQQLQEEEKSRTHDAHRNGHLHFKGKIIPNKLIIAVDVDEVLGNFISALNDFIRDRYGAHHTVSEYHVYEFFKIWNCSREEANIRVHEFFNTPYFKAGIHPIPGAKKVLHKLSRFSTLSVVTSRQHVIKDHTIVWIENHFPGLFQEMHFGNHFALAGESKPKSEICKSLGASVLIDDNPKYAVECAEAGIRTMLFDFENSYPWCKTDMATQHPLVTKVNNWEQVEQEIHSLIISESSHSDSFLYS